MYVYLKESYSIEPCNFRVNAIIFLLLILFKIGKQAGLDKTKSIVDVHIPIKLVCSDFGPPPRQFTTRQEKASASPKD